MAVIPRSRIPVIFGARRDTAIIGILDQFTDTNSVLLASHAIAPTNRPATSWTAVTGSFDIQSNQANVKTFVSNQAIATLNAGIADCTLSVIVSFAATAANDGLGIIFRYQDTTHFWLAQIANDVNEFQIYENNAGYTKRASTAFSPSVSTPYTIQVVLSGASISATVNGANAISYSSALFQALTVHGIRMGGTIINSRFDDFQITGAFA